MKKKIALGLSVLMTACAISAIGFAEDKKVLTMLGDLNMDGEHSISDVVIMRSGIVETTPFNDTTKKIADITKDETVDISDVVMLRAIIVGNLSFNKDDITNFVEVKEMFSIANDGSFTLTESMKKNSVVSEGNLTRLAKVIDKASKGEEVTIACIGGSITQGSLATDNFGYAYIMNSWWQEKFPDATFNFVNAGIGGTDSHLGVCRVAHQVIDQEPDLVIVEFSVNDTVPNMNKLTYEALLRTILESKTSPAVMTLFMTQENGTSLVDTHKPIGEYYDVPMISYKNAVLPVIENGDIVWKDIGADFIHPNDAGHSIAAALLENFWEDVLTKYNNGELDSLNYEIPSEYKEACSAKYMNMTYFDSASSEISVTTLGDFTAYKTSGFPNSWKWTGTDENSTGAIELDINKQDINNICLMYRGGTTGATVNVYVNDQLVQILDSSKQAYPQAVDIYSSTEATDTVHVKIEPKYNGADTKKNTFIFLGFGVN